MNKFIISNEAIESIILNATLGVEGVYDGWKGLEEHLPYLKQDKKHSHGIDFIIKGETMEINIYVIAKYNYDLKKLGEQIQQRVKAEVELMTPYKVLDVNVFISDILHEG